MSDENRKKGVKLCYVTTYICIMAIGMIQFGYTIAGFNSLKLVTLHRWGWVEVPDDPSTQLTTF